MEFDYGELKNDSSFVSRVQSVSEAIAKIEATIAESSKTKIEELSVEDRIKYDIFLTYAVNSLYFMYLKVEGDNTNTHGIKHELSRIKSSMERQKQIHDHNTIRPTLQQDVAKRLVRGGLYDFKAKNEDYKKNKQTPSRIHIHGNPKAVNRKRKFDDDN